MNCDRFSRMATGLLASLVSLALGAAPAGAASPGSRFVGTYFVTQVGGAGVQRMELRLGTDGHASMRTNFSRLTQRPVEAAAVPPVVEQGTWREQKGRVVVHITQTSKDDANAAQDQKPQFTELTFVLSGCDLRLVTDHGTSLEFSKRHCFGSN